MSDIYVAQSSKQATTHHSLSLQSAVTDVANLASIDPAQCVTLQMTEHVWAVFASQDLFDLFLTGNANFLPAGSVVCVPAQVFHTPHLEHVRETLTDKDISVHEAVHHLHAECTGGCVSDGKCKCNKCIARCIATPAVGHLY